MIVGLAILAVIFNPFLLMIPMIASGRYEGMRQRAPFEEAHQRAVVNFVESQGFGLSRIRKAGLWNEHTVSFEGKIYDPHEIRLIGMTPEYGPRLFTDMHPPKIKEIPDSPSRPLTPNELEALERLRRGESRTETFPPDPEQHAEGIRVMAPLFATQDCLKCHSVALGEMLGAFDYHLIPQSGESAEPPVEKN